MPHFLITLRTKEFNIRIWSTDQSECAEMCVHICPFVCVLRGGCVNPGVRLLMLLRGLYSFKHHGPKS